ncbi:MAG TPA: DcrB-related protein [Pseudonocardia sp.]|jgi:hypothetical protein|nr:DcrB-related protein [Pseudonocardia sp.]
MNWKISSACALIGVTVLAGCGSAEQSGPAPSSAAPQPPAEHYTDQNAGFSIDPPPGWRVGSSIDPVTVTFYRLPPDAAGGKPFPVNLNVVIAPTTDTLDANVAAAQAGLPGVLPGYQQTTDERTQLADGTPAHFMGGTYEQAGNRLQNMQLVTVGLGNAYVLTGTAPQASFSRYEQDLRRSLLTFKLPQAPR